MIKYNNFKSPNWSLHTSWKVLCFFYFSGSSNHHKAISLLFIYFVFCVCVCVPHPECSSHLPPHPIPLGHPSAPALSTLYHASNLDWWFVSHVIVYMFQCHSPDHPTLALSHRVQKTVLYIWVSFAFSI